MWAVIGAGEMLTQRRRGAKKTTIECSCTPSAPLRLSVIFSDHQTGRLMANPQPPANSVPLFTSAARAEDLLVRTLWTRRTRHWKATRAAANRSPRYRDLAPHPMHVN